MLENGFVDEVQEFKYLGCLVSIAGSRCQMQEKAN